MLLTLLTQIIWGQKIFRRANFLFVFSTPPGGPSGKLSGLKAIKAKLGESLAPCYDTKTCRNQRFGAGKRTKIKHDSQTYPRIMNAWKRMSAFCSNNGRLDHSVRFLSYMMACCSWPSVPNLFTLGMLRDVPLPSMVPASGMPVEIPSTAVDQQILRQVGFWWRNNYGN